MSAEPIPFPSPAPLNWIDFRLSHPNLWIDSRGGDGCAADWAALFNKYGGAAMREAYNALNTDGGRVFFDTMVRRLSGEIQRPRLTQKKGNEFDAVKALLSTRTPASAHLVKLALEAGVRNTVLDIAEWASKDQAILARLRKKGLI